MTEKLFYKNAYQKSFEGTVTGCGEEKGGFWATLDRTAFYPEGGGQPADTGTLGGERVTDVQEKEGEIRHFTGRPLNVGQRVEGEIDWSPRFSRMQAHSGEHIVSGLIHRLYGFQNVGFHMGHDAVTLDLNGELTDLQLARVERMANEAVWENLPIQVSYPSPEELRDLKYRSKKELSGQVRIVTVPGYDDCACCGTHVRATGEIGVIKLLTSQKYKGGVRVWMLCGGQALEDYDRKNRAVYGISALLSAKPGEVEQAVRRLAAENEELGQRAAGMQTALFTLRAGQYAQGTPLALVFEENLSPGDLRRYCLILCERCDLAAVFGGDGGGGWKYAVGSKRRDVRPLGKELNAAFCGRGGGAPELVQGFLRGERKELESFFKGRL